MKKILLILFLLVTTTLFSQGGFPVNSTVGSPKSTVLTKGVSAADSGYQYRTNFQDTGSANNGELKNVPGVVIRVRSDLWMRDEYALSWIKIGSNASVIDTTSLSDRINAKADTNSVWFKTGNSGTNPSVNYIGTNDEQPLVFKTNGLHAGLITARSGFSASVSGSVVLGQFAGDSLGINNGANTLIGHGAGANIIYNPSKGNQNTMIGLWAGYWTKYHSDPFGGRNVMVGQSAGFRNYNGSSLTYIGTFAGEANNQGNNNTGIGRDALRSNIDGNYHTGVGWSSLLNNTTGVKTITVTNGGSGYTTATVTISNPPGPTPAVLWAAATATATISGGAITGITVTDPGAGYSILYGGSGHWHDSITVTISGDGTGATAEVTETISGEANTALGYGSGYLDRFGKYNISIGYLTTLNNQLGENIILVGKGANVGSGSPSPILNSIAIGSNATVTASNTMSLGGVGADSVSVVIGGSSTTAGFELKNSKGAIIDSITIDAKGLSVGDQTSMAIGIGAMKNASGIYSTAIGYKSQEIPGSTSNQSHNTSVGTFTLQNVNQFGNSAFGSMSSKDVTTGYRNTGLGAYSNGTVSTGRSNTGAGFYSLYNANGLFNTGFGDGAGASITTGSYNTSIGSYSMGFSTLSYFPGTAKLTGSYNSSLGVGSLFNLTSGSYNTAVGFASGTLMTTGSYNTLIGGYSGASHATASRHTIISDGEGNIKFTADSIGNTSFSGTGGHLFQKGTTAQRPTNVSGTIRWNTDSSALEYADGSSWFKIGSSVGGTGTVTSIGTGYGLSGGTITTTGTLAIDTALISTRLWRQKGIDSVQGNVTSGLALKLNLSDTASMLTNYVRRQELKDTAAAIRSAIGGGSGSVTSVGSGYGLSGGTITTTGTILVDSASLSNYYLRRKDSLTASNLLGYVTRTVLADSAAAIRASIGSGGVADGYVDGATFSTSTNTLTLTQTGAADVTVRIPPSYLQNPIDQDSLIKEVNDSVGRIKAVKVVSDHPEILVTTTRNDSINTHTLSKIYISEPIATFSAGAGFVADTALFTDSTLYGSFFTDQDSFYITRVIVVMKGQAGDSLGIQIVHNDSINVTGTVIDGGTLAVNSLTTGNAFSVSTNQGIPPNSWVWVKSPTVIAGKRPEYLSITLVGYKKWIAP